MSEKLCVFCEHWSFDGGELGYSELTPGYDASMQCLKGHYKNTRLTDLYNAAKFRELILQAEKCKDYRQVKP